jgi:hypothetical protein
MIRCDTIQYNTIQYNIANEVSGVRTSKLRTHMCRHCMHRESLKFSKISFHSNSFILQKDGRTDTDRHRVFSILILVDFLWYLLTPWRIAILEKLTVPQPVKKFPEFYGTRKFITALTSARHLSLS